MILLIDLSVMILMINDSVVHVSDVAKEIRYIASGSRSCLL
jgi:hypothetical protein